MGLANHGKHRRVAGLRREEVANLAGVSVNYYTRLEQGQNKSPSSEVVDALAAALRLNRGETIYLQYLAHPERDRGESGAMESVRPELQAMITCYRSGPAVIIDRYTDILTWNTLAKILLSGHREAQASSGVADSVNLAKFLFLDPMSRELYLDWDREAREMAGYLRLMRGRHARDIRLNRLVSELRARSPEFEDMWSSYPVSEKTHGTRRLRHPDIGELVLRFETFRVTDLPDQCVVLYHADPGSPFETALHELVARAG